MGKMYDGGHLLAAWLFPAVGGFLYGYDIGAMAECLVALCSRKYSDVAWWSLLDGSAIIQGVVVACVTFGAMLGSIIVFHYEARLGRRVEMLIGATLYGFGSLSEGLAPVAWYGLVWLCVARVVYGVGVGFVMHGAPAYIAETSPASVRGALVSGKEAMIVVGMLAGYVAGGTLRFVVGGWRLVFWLATPLSIVMFVGVLALPPSPRWLRLRGKDPLPALRFMFPSLEVLPDDLRDLEPESAQAMSLLGAVAELRSEPAANRALEIGLGLVCFQQITGQPSVLYYVATIFSSVLSVILLALWKLVATLCAVASADDFGRKTLLYAGCTLMAIALGVLVVSSGYDSTSACMVTLVAMMGYIAGYQVGFGPVTWTVIAEVFPAKHRGKALSVAVFLNFALNTALTFAAAPLLNANASATFAIFLIFDLLALAFVRCRLLETRGLTLEQITRLLVDADNFVSPDEVKSLLTQVPPSKG